MYETDLEKRNKIILTAVKGCFALFLMLYFFTKAAHPDEATFLDSLNLIFHEAGHTIAFFSPHLVKVLAGSFFQVMIPVLLALYFFSRQERYSSALLLFWVGQSLVHVSEYAGDAVAMNLPLLGGDNSVHDWNFILSYFHALPHTDLISMLIYNSGVVMLIAGSALSFWYARPTRRHDLVVYVGALVTHEGKVLLVEENFEEAEGLWSLPIMPLQKKEEIENAARRVVAEEAGLTVGLFGVPSVVLTSGINTRTYRDHALCTIRLYLFDAAIVGESTPLSGLVKSYKWVDPKDIDHYSLRAEWMRLFVRAAIRVGETPRDSHYRIKAVAQ